MVCCLANPKSSRTTVCHVRFVFKFGQNKLFPRFVVVLKIFITDVKCYILEAFLVAQFLLDYLLFGLTCLIILTGSILYTFFLFSSSRPTSD